MLENKFEVFAINRHHFQVLDILSFDIKFGVQKILWEHSKEHCSSSWL